MKKKATLRERITAAYKKVGEFLTACTEFLGALIGCAFVVVIGFVGLYLVVRMIKWMWEQ